MRFVTFINSSYLPGLLNLIYSMRRFGKLDSIDLILITDDDLDQKSLELIDDRCNRFEVRSISSLGGDPTERPEEPRRLQIATKKLKLFNLNGPDVHCFIDADMLCLNDANGILSMPHFSAVPNQSDGGKFSYIASNITFNSGMFTFCPDDFSEDEVINYYHNSKHNFENGLGDQSIINQYMYEKYPEKLYLVDDKWNILKRRLNSDLSATQIKNDAVFLHYVGVKPWESINLLSSGNEAEFIQLNKLWWEVLHESGLHKVLGIREPNWRLVKAVSMAKKFLKGQSIKNKVRRV